jgi:hypothetical protein
MLTTPEEAFYFSDRTQAVLAERLTAFGAIREI